jgi:hypothetical protein
VKARTALQAYVLVLCACPTVALGRGVPMESVPFHHFAYPWVVSVGLGKRTLLLITLADHCLLLSGPDCTDGICVGPNCKSKGCEGDDCDDGTNLCQGGACINIDCSGSDCDSAGGVCRYP